MARAYWQLKGETKKTRFIGRQKGYHGVNFGGVAVGGIPANKHLFGEVLETDHLSHTMLPENVFSRGMPETGAHLAQELERFVELYGADTIAAVIVEPMGGSAGVLPPPTGYLKRLRELCDKHHILLIFDEVITGFGRCGAMTGSDAFGVVPDILNVAKQLTNGVIPMGAVIASSEIHNTFMEKRQPDLITCWNLHTAIPILLTQWPVLRVWRHSMSWLTNSYRRGWRRRHLISRTCCTNSLVKNRT
jgi:beta-alanine--pyruvate transaminase